MILFDSHLHTVNSHDGQVTCHTIAEEAIKRNLSGICITDHFDSGLYNESDDYQHIRQSIIDAKESAEKYKNKLIINHGVELGDYLFGKKIADRCLSELDFDFILCSTHATMVGRKVFGEFSGFKSLAVLSDEQIELFITEYFKHILKTVREQDFDSLAHLTYPLRYIIAVNKRKFDINPYLDIIRDIFKVIIQRNKAIEVNTSCLATEWKYTLPDFHMLKDYYDMGGRLITLGSDAHFTERIGLGFNQTLKNLKEIGFNSYHYYKERNPIAINI